MSPRLRWTDLLAPLALLAACVGAGALRGRLIARDLLRGEPVPGSWAAALDAAAWASDGTAGLTIPAAVGPLPQALAALCLRAAEPTLALGVLWGALVAACVAWGGWAPARPAARALALLLTTVAAFAAELEGIAGLLLWAAAARVSGGARPSRAGGWGAGVALALAAAWAPWAGIAGLALLGAALLHGWTRAARAEAAPRLAPATCVVGAALMVLAASGCAPVAVRSATSGLSLAALVPAAWAIPAAALVWLAARRARGDRGARLVVALLAPAAIGALLAPGLTPWAAAWPLAVGLALAAAWTAADEARPTTIARPMAWVVAWVFALGVAFAPALRAAPRAKAAALDPAPVRVPDGVTGWMRERDGCVSTVGALRPERLASEGRARPLWLSAATSSEPCPWAVARADPLRLDATAAAWPPAELLTLVERYARVGRLAHATSGWARRAAPATIERRPIRLGPSAERGGRETVFPLGAPVRRDALIALRLTAPGATVEVWLEGPGGPLDAPRPLEARADGFALVAPSARAAARRWLEGTPSPGAEATHLVLRHPRTAGDGGARPLEAFALTPPDGPADDVACEGARPFEAWRAGFTGSAGAAPEAEGFTLSARRGPTWVSAPITACPGACLYAEVGLVEGREARFRILADASGRRRTLTERDLVPRWRQPLEIPLERLAGEPATLAFVVESDGGEVVSLRRPRVGPCVALQSLVHALHDGRAATVPEGAAIDVEGDELRVPVFAASAEPARVELPLRVTREPAPCLAVELSARDHEGPVGVLVAVRHEGEVWWLSRLVLEPGEAPVMQSELALTPFADGGDATLIFSAWPFESPGGGHGVFTRPRVYPCGSEPGWAF
ncbi:MAG: hypothetical protein VYE22_34680 [Myxococcota bacterium]|nr:hypothetical protein [Myxococcota bacterium]